MMTWAGPLPGLSLAPALKVWWPRFTWGMGRPEADGRNGRQTVEVAHEALIRNWGRLRSWLNEDREFLLWRQRTQVQVEQWEQHGRDAGGLLRGVSLSEAERWLVGRPQDLTAAEQQFVSDSVTRRERDQETERRRRRLLRGWFGLLLVGLTVASLVFYRLRQEADFTARESKARELAFAGDCPAPRICNEVRQHSRYLERLHRVSGERLKFL